MHILIGSLMMVLVVLLWRKSLGGFLNFLAFFCIKIIIAGFFLYGVNYFFGTYGITIPINQYTLLFSGILGVPGIAVLALFQQII